MELKKRQDDTLAEVTSIEVKADGMVISAKADMPSYGKVRFSINVQSSGERNSGSCFGSGRSTWGACERGPNEMCIMFVSLVSEGHWGWKLCQKMAIQKWLVT